MTLGRSLGNLTCRSTSHRLGPDLPAPAAERVKGDLTAVRRPGRPPIGCGVCSQRLHLAAICRQRPQIAIPAAIGRDDQPSAVRRQVECFHVSLVECELDRIGPGGDAVAETCTRQTFAT